MRGSGPRMTISVRRAVLLLRRTGPRLLRPAQALERLRHAEHAEIVEAAADDLDADRKALGAKTAIDRDSRIFRHVPRHGVADVLERFCGIVYGGSAFGSEIHYRRHRRDDVIEIA